MCQMSTMVQIHTHYTSGVASMTYMKAVEAGADVIDTAICCMSGGTAQPSTETMAYALEQLGFENDLDMEKINEVNEC